jgi:hypothetical protein
MENENRTIIRSIYCKSHGGFHSVKRTFHEFDSKLELEKLMAELDCGCTVWMATIERDPEVLKYLP